jgi:hypothetical protein
MLLSKPLQIKIISILAVFVIMVSCSKDQSDQPEQTNSKSSILTERTSNSAASVYLPVIQYVPDDTGISINCYLVLEGISDQILVHVDFGTTAGVINNMIKNTAISYLASTYNVHVQPGAIVILGGAQ